VSESDSQCLVILQEPFGIFNCIDRELLLASTALAVLVLHKPMYAFECCIVIIQVALLRGALCRFCDQLQQAYHFIISFTISFARTSQFLQGRQKRLKAEGVDY